MTETTAPEAPAADAPAESAEKAAAKGNRDFTKILEKDPTNLHVHYWGWLQEKTGFEAKTDDAEATKIVQMAVSLYQQYQASAENKQRRVDEANEREEKAAEAKAARAAAAAEKAAKAAEAKAASKSEAEAAGDEKGATRQPPPRKGNAKTTAAAGKAPF